MSINPEEQWKIDTNDRYQKVVSTFIALATSSLVLPTLFLKQFLNIPEKEPLINHLNGFAYAYWAFLSLAILGGVIFYYSSAKWIKSAWGQRTAISQKGIEIILDWSFWFMVLMFFVGLAFLFTYITTYEPVANSEVTNITITPAVLSTLKDNGVSMANEKDWIDILSALLTPTIAILGTIIAILQWKTNSNRLKHELFDKRYDIYNCLKAFISSILTSGKAHEEHRIKFLVGTKGSTFLFDKKITEYLDEIHSKAVDLQALESEREGLGRGEELSKNVKTQADIKKWLIKQLEASEQKFLPYIKLKH